MAPALITFHDRDEDQHVAGRPHVLRAPSWFPPPDGVQVLDVDAAGVVDRLHLLRESIDRSGLAQVRTGRPLTNRELLDLGEALGRPMPEHAPAVQPYVDDGAILNLVMANPETGDVDLQPFAENPITLHTESSLRPFMEQPNYLVFVCLAAPEAGHGGQTILVPMPAVLDRLTERDRAILHATRYASAGGCPTILSEREGRAVFSFRDFGDAPLEVRCGLDGASGDEVRAALAALLAAMYRPEAVRGVHWEAATLVVLDNTRFFHGRLFGRGGPGATRRHLKRLRVRPPLPDAA